MFILSELDIDYEMECVPGEFFKRDCNHCMCTEYGTISCTRLNCDFGGEQCTPGEKWKEDCNECYCEKNGVPTCVDKNCNEWENVKTIL